MQAGRGGDIALAVAVAVLYSERATLPIVFASVGQDRGREKIAGLCRMFHSVAAPRE